MVEQAKNFDVQGVESGLSAEAGNVGLFSETSGEVLANDNLGSCGVCSMQLTVQDKLASTIEQAQAHQECVLEQIGSGSFSVLEVRQLETLNAIQKQAWVAQLPEVKEAGCAQCNKSWDASDRLLLVDESADKPAFMHRACLETLVTNSFMKSWDVRKIAKMNGFGITNLVPGSNPVCHYCKVAVGEDALHTTGGAFSHRVCLWNLHVKGQLDKDTLAKTCELNGIHEVDLLKGNEVWEKLRKEMNLRKKAEGETEGLWQRFKSWLSGVAQSLSGLISGYDQAIDTAEDAIAQMGGEQAEVAPVMAAIRRLAIDPEVQKAMDLLLTLEKAEQDRQKRLAEIAAQYHVQAIDKAKLAAAEKVKEYIASLTSKQRRYNEALFRLKEVKHRGTFQATMYRDAVKALVANDQNLTAQVVALEAQATKAGFTTQEVDVLLQTQPSEVTPEVEQLQTGVTPPTTPAPSAPSPSAPARAPRRSSAQEEQLFD